MFIIECSVFLVSVRIIGLDADRNYQIKIFAEQISTRLLSKSIRLTFTTLRPGKLMKNFRSSTFSCLKYQEWFVVFNIVEHRSIQFRSIGSPMISNNFIYAIGPRSIRQEKSWWFWMKRITRWLSMMKLIFFKSVDETISVGQSIRPNKFSRWIQW